MGQTAANFRRNLIKKMARRAAAIVRPLIPSRTLRRALRISQPQEITKTKEESALDALFSGPRPSTVSRLSVHLTIAHYWALYVHDGRAGFGPLRAQVLVWFRNPRDDPRHKGTTDYPVRAADIRRLTREEFYEGVKINRALGSKDNPFPYMVIAKWRGGDRPHRFFSEGLAGLGSKLTPLVETEMDRFIRSNLFSDTDKVTARF